MRPRVPNELSPSELSEITADPLRAIRAACAFVAENASFVRIDARRLVAYAHEVPKLALEAAQTLSFPGLGESDEERCAFVLALDTINFGSGYWPHLRKRPGHSGYRTVEASLLDVFRTRGPLTAEQLRASSAEFCAELFGQELTPPIDELMELFARAWRELGERVADSYGGSFRALVADAHGSAENLVRSLLELPMYRDITPYRGRLVPLLKRAQIAAADLAAVLSSPLGKLDGLDRLTLFSDNLVPHVLRLDGVLRFAPELVARIEAEDLLEQGSPEEVEIRACAVHAVELLSRELARLGRDVPPHALDRWLWTRGGGPTYKAKPRHRSRSWFY